MALVANGKQDGELNKDPQTSLFDKPMTRVTRSTFTYITLSPDKEEENTYTFRFNKIFDLIGDCYITLKRNGCDDDPLVCVSFQFKFKERDPSLEEEWRTMESLDMHGLKAHAAMNPDAFKPCHDDDSIMVPLPFFFTHSTMDHFPMVQNMLFRIVCVTNNKDNLPPPLLTFKAVYLDSHERSQVILNKRHTKLYTMTRTHRYEAWGPIAAVSLRDVGLLVRDLQITVEDENGFVRVPELRLSLNGHTHCTLSSLMTTQMIPQKHYKMSCSPALSFIHYIPFCQAPLDMSKYTSSVNFSRIDFAQLLLKGLVPNTHYKVTVVERHWNTVNFSSGMCNVGFVEVTAA